jgi:hypothetical protein
MRKESRLYPFSADYTKLFTFWDSLMARREIRESAKRRRKSAAVPF